ncbi:hypothetical protein D3C80_585920 [compost metagenome]
MCEFADLLGDDGKALACFPGPRRFHTRIQSQKVGLERDLVDYIGNLGDLTRGLLDSSHRFNGIANDRAGLDRAFLRLADHGGRFIGPLGRGPHDGGDLIESGRRFFKGCRLLLGALRQIVGGAAQFGRAVIHGTGGIAHLTHGGLKCLHRTVDVFLQFGKCALEISPHAVGEIAIGKAFHDAARFRYAGIDAFDELVDIAGHTVKAFDTPLLINATSEIALGCSLNNGRHPRLQIVTLCLQTRLGIGHAGNFQAVRLEDFDGCGHVANFVPAAGKWHGGIIITVSKAPHRRCQLKDRTANLAASKIKAKAQATTDTENGNEKNGVEDQVTEGRHLCA